METPRMDISRHSDALPHDEPDGRRTPVIVLYEDRPNSLAGLKLTALSLLATSPGIELQVIVPGAPVAFKRWIEGRGIAFIDTPLGKRPVSGWDVKPTALLSVLESGVDEVVWVDTDIIASSDIMTLIGSLPPRAFIATEEYYWGFHQGSPVRTHALGLEVARIFPNSINSGVLRVQRHHIDLLTRWAELLSSAAYVNAQNTPITRRPIAFLSDQEVLGGLLGSRDFADIEVVQLRRGIDIAQCFGPSGFTVKERWAHRHDLPPLIHAMGRKPWMRPKLHGLSALGRLGAQWENAHLDLTPYAHVARTYLSDLDEATEWIGPVTAIGRLLSRIGPPAMREIPLSVLDSGQRGIRRILGIRQIGV